MQKIQHLSHGGQDCHGLSHRKNSPGVHNLGQGTSRRILHDEDKRAILVCHESRYRDQMFMPELGQKPPFSRDLALIMTVRVYSLTHGQRAGCGNQKFCCHML